MFGRHGCWVAVALAALACGRPSTPRASPPERAPREPVVVDTPAVETPAVPERLAMTWNGACAVRAGGDVVCWGPAWGDAVREIEGLSGVVEIVGTTVGACARVASGQVRCWSPERDLFSIGIDDAVDLGRANDEVCAVRRGGAVACWGGPFGEGSWRPEYDDAGWPEPERAVDEELMEARADRDYEGLSDEVFEEDEDRYAPWFGTAMWRHVIARRDIEGAVAIAGTEGAWCARRRTGPIRCWTEDVVSGVDLDPIAAVDLTVGGRPAQACVTVAGQGALCRSLDGEGAWTPVPGAGSVTRFVRAAPERHPLCWSEAAGLLCSEADAEPVSFWAALDWSEAPTPTPAPIELRIQRDVACARYAEGPVRCWGGPGREPDEEDGASFGGAALPRPVEGTR